MVSEGKFREDLWYRIAVFPILVPSLKERNEDIPALVEHFARKAATKFGLPFVPPADADVRLLQTYDWPGNIRELGAVIDRAAILGEGKTLEIAASLGSSAIAVGRDPTSSRDSNRSVIPRTSQIRTLDDAMRSHIEAALAATQGRIEGALGAAALLQINPHTLRARMRKLKLDWRSFRPQPS
jgi:DNA-binding NtrC family response regulator